QYIQPFKEGTNQTACLLGNILLNLYSFPSLFSSNDTNNLVCEAILCAISGDLRPLFRFFSNKMEGILLKLRVAYDF
uniref:Uncharacterized protein n=1 Tax=Meloidogyne floridensis TaxID=298350 RepID=A0A915NXE4_9BILA